jgi:hypothetical protein
MVKRVKAYCEWGGTKKLGGMKVEKLAIWGIVFYLSDNSAVARWQKHQNPTV